MDSDESVEGTRSEWIANAGPILLEGLATLLTGLGAAFVVGYLTEHIGFVDEKRRALMLPANLALPTNSLFQYGVCLLTVIGVGALYARVVLSRMGRTARRIDLLVTTATLVVVWLTSLAEVAVPVFVARALIAAWLASPSGNALVERHEIFERLAAWAPPAAVLAFAWFFSLTVPPGVTTSVAATPPWLLALLALPAALFLVEDQMSPRARLWERRIGFALGLAAIPLVTFRIAAAVFDSDVIVGPVSDLMRGKDILDSVVSTYGFLFSYALAATFRIFHVTDLYIGLAVINAIAYSVGYAAIFVFLYFRIRRFSLLLASMIAVVAIHYFHLNIPVTWLPQIGFLRFGAMLPVFLLLFALDERSGSRALEWLLAACFAIGSLWTVEVGGYMTMALAAALGRELLFHEHGYGRALRIAGKIAVVCAAMFIFFTARIWIRHGHWPFWGDLLHFQRAYSAGLAMGRLHSVERWPIPVLISLITIFITLRAPQSMRHANAWVFLAVFTLAAMVYPIGKAPGTYELTRIMLPTILLIASAVSFLDDHRERLFVVLQGKVRFNVSSVTSAALIGTAALGTCFVYAEAAPWLAKMATLERTNTKPIAHESPSWEAFFPTPDARKRFQQDLESIRTLVPADEAVPMVSKNDTIYYVFAPRKALFKNSFYPHFFFKSDLDDIAKELLASKVPYLWVDNALKFQSYENAVDRTIADGVWSRVAAHYRLIRRAGYLDVYQRTPH